MQPTGAERRCPGESKRTGQPKRTNRFTLLEQDRVGCRASQRVSVRLWLHPPSDTTEEKRIHHIGERKAEHINGIGLAGVSDEQAMKPGVQLEANHKRSHTAADQHIQL